MHFLLWRYGLAVLALTLALLVKQLLDPIIFGQASLFLVFFASAVILSTWYGGMRVGLFVTVLAAFASDYFLVHANNSLLGIRMGENLQLSLFLSAGVLISGLTRLLHSSNSPILVDTLQTQKDQQNGNPDAEHLGKLYQILCEQAGDIVLGIHQGQIIAANHAALKAYGYQQDELLSLKIQDLIALPCDDFDWEKMAPTDNQGILFETIHRRKDGRTFPVEVSAQCTVTGQEKVILSIIRDITERQRIEEELKQSEQQYRDLADAMPLIVWTAEPDGTVDYFNQRWFDYTGMTPEQSQGWAWQPVLHPDDLPLCLERWNEALRTGKPYEIEYRFKGCDGTYRWQLGRALPMRDQEGRVLSWVGTCTDIDAQKRTEETERFIAQASKELASSLDYQTTLTNVARLCVPHLADWCAVDMVDQEQSIRRLVVVHTDPSKVESSHELHKRYPPRLDDPYGVPKVLRTGQSELYPQVSDHILSGIAHNAEHLAMLRQIGCTSAMIVPLTVRSRTLGAITLVSAESGRLYSLSDLMFAEELARRAGLAVDNASLLNAIQQELTYRRQTEAALRDRAGELANLSTVLAHTNASLEKRNQELDQFAYIVSHDLKAPLRAIANLSTWIEEDIQDQLSEETRHQMGLLQGRVHRMEALINGLLQYSRIGRVKTSVQKVNVENLLADVIDSLAPPPGFTIVVKGPMPTLDTERIPLEQVFANLIGNGIKHHNRLDGHVTISVRALEDFYEFAVADDGPGIDPRYHDKVFVIFQTLEARDKVENTGVGLAIVKKIIENKGGNICLESQVGQGATFYFTWPSSTKSNEGSLNDKYAAY